MQPWLSILLILITIIGFGFGFYYDQVKKNSIVAVEESFFLSKPDQKVDGNSSIIPKSKVLQKSSAWAETKVFLELPFRNSNLMQLHKEAIVGKVFLSLMIDKLKSSPTAKELIFSPFLNEIFIESERDILLSLFSIIPNIEIPNQLTLIVRGHSQKSSTLLTKLILDTYKSSIEQETSQNPIHPKLSDQRQKILMLEENQIQLATQIQEENFNSNVQSIEEIAIRSELMQISTDLKSHHTALQDIEKIHRNKKGPSEYLTIHFLANFGNIQDIINKIDQLKTMLVNQKLEVILKKEITKNLKALEASLNQELASGIEQIKVVSKDAIKKKADLHKKLSDIEVKKSDLHAYHPRFKLLKTLKNEIDQKKAEFSISYKQWQSAKKGLIFKKAS